MFVTGPDPRALLTDAQLACVRRVPAGTSKRIAIELNISHHTVNQHLKSAMQRLGVRSRYEAFDLVRAWDTDHPHDLVSPPQGLVDAPADGSVVGLPASLEVPAHVGEALQEERVRFDPGPRAQHRDPSIGRLVRHWLESFHGDLSPADRLRKIATAALAFAVLVLLVVAVGESLQRSLKGLGY